MDISLLPRGTQIVYVPGHAKAIDHPACELGFVTGVIEGTNSVFCRYFLKGSDELRTTFCSELTPFATIRIIKHRDQAIIARLIQEIDAERMAEELSG